MLYPYLLQRGGTMTFHCLCGLIKTADATPSGWTIRAGRKYAGYEGQHIKADCGAKDHAVVGPLKIKTERGADGLPRLVWKIA